MGFWSFLRRVCFASFFIFSAWQMFNEFGDDGGPAAKEWARIWTDIRKILINHNITETTYAPSDLKAFVAALIFINGVGSVLFMAGSIYGAHILAITTPFLYDFVNKEFGGETYLLLLHEYLQCLSLVGAALIFISFKYSI